MNRLLDVDKWGELKRESRVIIGGIEFEKAYEDETDIKRTDTWQAIDQNIRFNAVDIDNYELRFNAWTWDYQKEPEPEITAGFNMIYGLDRLDKAVRLLDEFRHRSKGALSV